MTAICELCGEPMSEGEEMFKIHGYFGPCPKPPLPLSKQIAAEVSGWRTIDSAPKDGTPILCYRPDSEEHGFSTQSSIDVLWWDFGWMCAGEIICIDPPTHWMPLPGAPRDAVSADALCPQDRNQSTERADTQMERQEIDDLPQPDFINENDHQALAVFWRKYASDVAAKRSDLRELLGAIQKAAECGLSDGAEPKEALRSIRFMTCCDRVSEVPDLPRNKALDGGFNG